MKRTKGTRNNRAGFSLVELVVVVLIMGILAAVAAPRLFDKMSDARESATRQSLAVLRSGIELYKAENGDYPADISVDLENEMIKGAFPKAEIVTNGNADVVVKTDNADLAVDTGSTASWIYNSTTGEVRINDALYFAW